MDKNHELLLCGSGLPAFAHIGVLKALEERGARASSITGASTGALVAALHANGVKSSVIQDLFLNRHPQRFNSADWLGVRDGCQATPRMFHPVVDLVPTAQAFVRANGLKPVPGLSIVCYDLLSQRPVIFTGSNYDLATALAGACAVPGISRPVRTGKYLLVDVAGHEWQPKSVCGTKAIISRATYRDDETTKDAATQLDRWLKQRRQLLRVVECKLTDCCRRDHVVIETALSAKDGCGCALNDTAIAAVVQQGYVACQKARLE
jgi:hypothetical protein